jgi:drug/metabolite transporter (DMT)-like permease
VLEYGALLAMVALTCFGQVMMKLGAVRVDYGGGAVRLLRSFANRYVLWGAAATLCAPFFYIFALTRIDLAVAFSFTGLNYVAVLAASRWFLRERVHAWQWAGVALICAGVVVFNG